MYTDFILLPQAAIGKGRFHNYSGGRMTQQYLQFLWIFFYPLYYLYFSQGTFFTLHLFKKYLIHSLFMFLFHCQLLKV